MKFNISYPLNGSNKTVEIDDDKKCSIFFDKRMGTEVEADNLGDEYKGYIFKITGGNDVDGFPMKQGVIVKGRIRLLLSEGHSCYRPRRNGERKRKTIRGCIVGPDIRVLALQLTKKGTQEIPGLTDVVNPRRLGPKRATRIRKLFGLSKNDPKELIKKNVVRRHWTAPNGKQRQKAPKIQRLVTDERLRRKRIYKQEKKDRWLKSRQSIEEYNKLLSDWRKKRRAQAEKADEAKRTAATATTTTTTGKAPATGKTTTTGKAPLNVAVKTAPKTVTGKDSKVAQPAGKKEVAAKTGAQTTKPAPAPAAVKDQKGKAPAPTATKATKK